jgi:hypothetical protein
MIKRKGSADSSPSFVNAPYDPSDPETIRTNEAIRKSGKELRHFVKRVDSSLRESYLRPFRERPVDCDCRMCTDSRSPNCGTRVLRQSAKHMNFSNIDLALPVTVNFDSEVMEDAMRKLWKLWDQHWYDQNRRAYNPTVKIVLSKSGVADVRATFYVHDEKVILSTVVGHESSVPAATTHCATPALCATCGPGCGGREPLTYDGLTKDQCFARFEALQRDEPGTPSLTPVQKEIARTTWSEHVKSKARGER